MARTDLNIPTLGRSFVDYRDPIPGDSYNFSWVRPLSQVNYLAIHHTAAPDTQTPDEIANYHINNNGWGGIGYHFLIDKNGLVYYVGDISTARANVANLNEQVIGICLIGNFTQGRAPTQQQLDSAHKLCDFFINNYPPLTNVNSWDKVRGHKELPGQSTACPGDNFTNWRIRIVEGVGVPSQPTTPTPPTTDRGAQITESYRVILGRDPDMGGLQTYTNGSMTLDQIRWSMANSPEHHSLVAAAKRMPVLESQVSGLQTSLASINQQVISLRETLQQREQEIGSLRQQLQYNPPVTVPPVVVTPAPEPSAPPDTTLTIVGALIKLYEFLFPARKVTP